MTVDYAGCFKELYERAKEKGCGPILIRLSWHDSGTYQKEKGCGGARGTIRFAPEANYGCNAGLEVARDLIIDIKDNYPDITYADFFAMAGLAGIIAMEGPRIPFRPGRKDGQPDECSEDGVLPDGDKDRSHVRWVFNKMGFDDRAIVALSGAHSVGRCHKERSGFIGPWTNNPLKFDNEYYKLLLSEEWEEDKDKPKLQYKDKKTGELMMLHTDLELIWCEGFKPIVEEYAKDQDKFFEDFAKYMQQLQELGHKDLMEDVVDIYSGLDSKETKEGTDETTDAKPAEVETTA
eukprot:Clim_evm11s85 gene=Clim_evmTU11s85